MRPALRQKMLGLHRWIAFAIGMPAVVVALSGAALVFRPEISGGLAAPAWPAGAWERAAAAAKRIDAGADAVEIAPRAGRAEVLVGGKSGRTLVIDPADGRVLADEGAAAMAFPFLFKLHTRFLTGSWAEWIAALAGLALLVSSATGLALAWPVSARAWGLLLRLRTADGWRPFATDLHRVLGLAVLPLLALNAATGLVLVFSSPVAAWVSAVRPRPPEPAVSWAQAPCAPCTLDELVAHAERLIPGARAMRVVTGAAAVPVLVRLRRAGENETQGMNRVWIDATSGEVRRVVPLERAPAGAALFDWLYPLHTGRFVGLAWCTLLAAAGFAPLVSLASGIALWRARRRPRKSAPRP